MPAESWVEGVVALTAVMDARCLFESGWLSRGVGALCRRFCTWRSSLVVTTPRYHVQYVVTEHGITHIEGLGDRERARALVEIAHPDFRDELRATI